MSESRFFNKRPIIANAGMTIVCAGRSIIIDGTGALYLNGVAYSLNDPAAAEKLSDENQKMFWSLCTDTAKDSDIYRNYANKILINAKIDLNRITNPEMRLIILNQAQNVVRLNEYFSQKNNVDWLSQLTVHRDQDKMLLKKVDSTLTLLTCLSNLRYDSPLSLLKNMEATYLELLLDKSYNFNKLMEGLKKIGHSEPFSFLLTIDIPRLTYFIDSHYNTFQFLNTLQNIGYTDPVNTIAALGITSLKLLLDNHYNASVLLNAFKKLEYEEVLSLLLSIDSEKLNFLFQHHYAVTVLLQLFKELKYTDPLKTLIDLDNTTLSLLFNNHYNASRVIKALYDKKIKDPVAYLIKLGTNAMVTIFNFGNEYVSRINRDVKLELEFQPTVAVAHEFQVAVKANNKFKPELEDFIEQAKQNQSNIAKISTRDINPDDLNAFKDIYTQIITDIPVMLGDDLFDLATLLKLKPNSDGYRTNPISKAKFSLSDLQPATDVQKKFDALIAASPEIETHTDRMDRFGIC